MSSQILILCFLVLIISLFSLVTVNTAFRCLQRKGSKRQLDQLGKLFFYRLFSLNIFAHQEYEALYFANLFTQHVLRFVYVTLTSVAIIYTHLPYTNLDATLLPTAVSQVLHWPQSLLYFCLSFFLLFFVDYLARVLATHYPKRMIKLCASIVSGCMTIFIPFNYLFFKLFHIFPQIYADPSHEPTQEARHELLEMIEEFNLNTQLDIHDKKLLESAMEFKHRIAREIMVPRVDLFCLSFDTTIEEAATLLYEEGYSRIPIYKDTLDNIIGVLMYKDVLAKYMDYAKDVDGAVLQAPVSTLMKNILYTPETKKISHLLQEFRKKQVHLAIIVNEYGGTEGIVTIEDILEEIVGDIADEYDETEALFLPLTEGGWLVDARMNILDIEEQLGIAIPQDGDYDTLGGYIFHETGMIPTKGYLITQPHFEIEILRSNARRVEKLRIKAFSAKEK